MTSHTTTVLESINPATGRSIDTVPVSSPEEVRAGVARAAAAAAAWRELTPLERAERLARVGGAIDDAREQIAGMITAEMGKLAAAARGESTAAARALDGDKLRSWAAALEPETIVDGEIRTRIVRDPLGVAAVITPWNFPASMAQSMMVPALLAGNTVVVKPSELTPLTGALLTGCYQRELPSGVVEIVQGDDAVGRALVAADVQLIAFVGSQAAGKSIMAAAADQLKRLVLELGGKDAMVVLDDADVDRAAQFAVHGAFRHAGQVCVSVERVYVDRSIHAAFQERVLEYARRYKVGDGNRDDVHMGPMVSDEARRRVVAQLDDARARGARVFEVADCPEGDGYFLSPAVVFDADDDMLLMQEETFGPVLAVQAVDDAETAVAKANAGDFGLGATLWSSSPARAAQLAARLDAGMVGINRSIGGASGTPWVGAKQSGFGFTGSIEGLRQFTQVRKISW